MAYKIQGVVRLDDSGNANLGIASATEFDGKVSEKAITEQTNGAIGDVTGADELLLYDTDTGDLLRVTVDEFIGGAGIGSIVTNFDQLNVAGDVTAGKFIGDVRGSALTAGSLTTARTLWGTNFDGTANVAGSLEGVFNITGPQDMIIAPEDSFSAKSITIRGNNDINGLGGNVFIGERGRGAIYFKTGTTDYYRFLKAGNTTGVEGILDFDQLTEIRRFEFPDADGTLAITNASGNFVGNVEGNLSGNSTGLHNGDVYSRLGTQLVLEVPVDTGDAHYIGTVTGDVAGDLIGDSSGTHTGQTNGDVYTADGGQQVVDTAASPAPIFRGDAEGLTGTPNISVGNVSVGGSIIPTTNIAYDLGTDANRFRDLYLEGNTIFLGNKQLSSDTLVTSSSGIITATGFDATGIITAASFHGDGSAIDNIGVTGIGFGLEYNYSSNNNLPGTQSGSFRLATTGFFQGLAIHEDDLRGVDQSSFFDDITEDKRYTIYMEYAGGTCFYSGLFYNFDSSLYTFFNGELTGDLPANGTACKLMIINEVGRSIFTQDFRATGISSVANLTISGITTMSDHLIIDDATGAGTEYALNVKTSGTSRFGVLGNGNVLLGNSSSTPFIAINDHHATSKKYVDDAISSASFTSVKLTGGPVWSSGIGSPEAVVTASVGSLYSRTDGGAGTTLYVKETGSGNTGWVAK